MMRSYTLENWAQNVFLIPDHELRVPGSKHQRKIKEFQDIIKDIAGYRSTPENLSRLLAVEHIKCNGGSTYVAHCRYLQYSINWIKQNIRLNEGGEE